MTEESENINNKNVYKIVENYFDRYRGSRKYSTEELNLYSSFTKIEFLKSWLAKNGHYLTGGSRDRLMDEHDEFIDHMLSQVQGMIRNKHVKANWTNIQISRFK